MQNLLKRSTSIFINKCFIILKGFTFRLIKDKIVMVIKNETRRFVYRIINGSI